MTRPADPVDSYLLRVLVTLVTERSVSRSAIKLNQTQPAISKALNRLRDVYGDPLLVREKGGMAVTERAVALREHARRALTELDAMRAGAEQFDAASSQQTFRIGSPYLLVNTDLVFTTARHFAAHFVRLLPLAISPAPFDFPRMRFYQLWHERSQQSPPHRWFRGL